MSPSPSRYRRAGRTTGTCGLAGRGRQRQPVRVDRAAAAGSGGEQFGGVVGIEQPAVEQAREPLRMAVPGGQRAQAGLGAAHGLIPAVSADIQPCHAQVVPVAEAVLLQSAVLECVEERVVVHVPTVDSLARPLVQVAENALQYFEKNLVAAGLDEVTELVKASHQARRSRFDSYRVIIQGLQLSVAVMFLLAAVYALVSA